MSAAPFRTCVVLLASALGLVRTSNADPVMLFSTLGPPPGYLDSAYEMSDQSFKWMGFELSESATLTSILLPARWGDRLAGGVSVSVRGSIDGVPDISIGSIIEHIAVPRPADAVPGGVSWITATSVLHPLLEANTLYFLSLHVCCGFVDTIGWPMNNAGIQGPVTNFFFPPATVTTGTLAAFELTGEPAPVPEPATLLLVAAGGGAIVNRARRRRASR